MVVSQFDGNVEVLSKLASKIGEIIGDIGNCVHLWIRRLFRYQWPRLEDCSRLHPRAKLSHQEWSDFSYFFVGSHATSFCSHVQKMLEIWYIYKCTVYNCRRYILSILYVENPVFNPVGANFFWAKSKVHLPQRRHWPRFFTRSCPDPTSHVWERRRGRRWARGNYRLS